MSGEGRVTVSPDVMLGQPVVAGTRLPVYVIVEAVAEGASFEVVLEAYPFLCREDIAAALHYAARLAEHGLEVA